MGYDNLGALSMQRVYEDYGWKPKITIERGMELYLDWLRENM